MAKNTEQAMEQEPISIALKIVETKKLSWRDIVQFQPKGFKIGNTDGLRKSIANNELLDRFKVFALAGIGAAKGKQKYFMFDGHTRQQVMLEMEQDGGYSFPHELECDVLAFPDKKHAATALLEYQSGKLKISELGLIEFADSVKMDSSELINLSDEYGIEMVRGIVDGGHEQSENENEGKQPNSSLAWFINIRCDNEKHAQKLYEEFIEKGLDVKIIT